ncbi:MAG: hypothetical protein DRR19_21730 [Candidatus Parabeggiatoa sp. nov. 1]|nr:MAG: hypothetical protein DRR19_21730 [Gammaproteobacteria bacterium]HEC85657.1 hypothetical protein [Thioploca sp.]
MKQTFTYFIIALLVSGCSTPPKADNPQQPQSANRSITGNSDNQQSPSDNRSATRDLGASTQLPQPNQKGLSTPPVKDVKKCADYESAVTKAVQAYHLKVLEQLLTTLNRQPDCPVSYLDAIKRSMAQIAAARADSLVQLGQLAEAETWLKRAPTMVWGTQAVYGDIAARRQQWQLAAQFYNQALDLIADPEATPQEPSQTVIKKVYYLASEAQILAGNLGAIVSQSGKASGMMRDNVRGVEFKKRPIPIPFEYGKTTLGEKGQNSAQRLAGYLKQQNAAHLTLIGHTDSKGSHAVNDKISKQRAEAVKKSLQTAGVPTKITAIGKGKREPLQLANRTLYTPEEIDALNRRVEFMAN